jgi:hypothetical protein
MEDIARRADAGMTKYGTTLARTDIGLREWAQHMYEELLDAAVYLRRALMDIEGAKADIFWDYSEPGLSLSYGSVEEIMHNHERGNVVLINRATGLPEVWAAEMPTADDTGTEICVFHTRAEAEDWVRERSSEIAQHMRENGVR